MSGKIFPHKETRIHLIYLPLRNECVVSYLSCGKWGIFLPDIYTIFRYDCTCSEVTTKIRSLLTDTWGTLKCLSPQYIYHLLCRIFLDWYVPRRTFQLKACDTTLKYIFEKNYPYWDGDFRILFSFREIKL